MNLFIEISNTKRRLEQSCVTLQYTSLGEIKFVFGQILYYNNC